MFCKKIEAETRAAAIFLAGLLVYIEQDRNMYIANVSSPCKKQKCVSECASFPERENPESQRLLQNKIFLFDIEPANFLFIIIPCNRISLTFSRCSARMLLLLFLLFIQRLCLELSANQGSWQTQTKDTIQCVFE